MRGFKANEEKAIEDPAPIKISHKKDGCRSGPHVTIHIMSHFLTLPPPPNRWIRYRKEK